MRLIRTRWFTVYVVRALTHAGDWAPGVWCLKIGWRRHAPGWPPVFARWVSFRVWPWPGRAVCPTPRKQTWKPPLA